MLDNFLKIISQVKRTLFTCTYVLSIGVLRTRGLRPRFALHVLNSLRKSDKMVGKPRILSLFPNSFNKFNKI